MSIYHANACNGNLSHIICVRSTHSSCQKDKANSSASQLPSIYCQRLGGKAPADHSCMANIAGRKLGNQA